LIVQNRGAGQWEEVLTVGYGLLAAVLAVILLLIAKTGKIELPSPVFD
jgi:hypothetical protein